MKEKASRRLKGLSRDDPGGQLLEDLGIERGDVSTPAGLEVGDTMKESMRLIFLSALKSADQQ